MATQLEVLGTKIEATATDERAHASRSEVGWKGHLGVRKPFEVLWHTFAGGEEYIPRPRRPRGSNPGHPSEEPRAGNHPSGMKTAFRAPVILMHMWCARERKSCKWAPRMPGGSRSLVG